MLGLVGGRLLSCEARAWRQGRIRDSVLGQVLEMHAQNEGRAADPEMFQWARIKQLEAAKLEARPPSGWIAPRTPQPHAAQRTRARATALARHPAHPCPSLAPRTRPWKEELLPEPEPEPEPEASPCRRRCGRTWSGSRRGTRRRRRSCGGARRR